MFQINNLQTYIQKDDNIFESIFGNDVLMQRLTYIDDQDNKRRSYQKKFIKILGTSSLYIPNHH